MAGKAGRTYALLSRGLWRQRDDIARLLEADVVAWPFVLASKVDGFVGWGRRPSGLRAGQLAERVGQAEAEALREKLRKELRASRAVGFAPRFRTLIDSGEIFRG